MGLVPWRLFGRGRWPHLRLAHRLSGEVVRRIGVVHAPAVSTEARLPPHLEQSLLQVGLLHLGRVEPLTRVGAQYTAPQLRAHRLDRLEVPVRQRRPRHRRRQRPDIDPDVIGRRPIGSLPKRLQIERVVRVGGRLAALFLLGRASVALPDTHTAMPRGDGCRGQRGRAGGVGVAPA
eukprot:scaffold6948_cov99-Isochrysis_galbana.AAC.3